MKKNIVLALVFVLGTTAVSFAGNRPAVTYAAGQLVLAGTPVPQAGVAPGKSGSVQYAMGISAANVSNDICPVMGHRITSKRNAVVFLSNGKHVMVCCSPCKKDIDQNVDKYKDFMF
jgi:hypothetical protein